jgi:hypothetical protein
VSPACRDGKALLAASSSTSALYMSRKKAKETPHRSARPLAYRCSSSRRVASQTARGTSSAIDSYATTQAGSKAIQESSGVAGSVRGAKSASRWSPK